MFRGLSPDLFKRFDDGRCVAEAGIGECHIVQALVAALVVVTLNEGLHLGLEAAGQEAISQQDAVLEGLVPALDLPWVWVSIFQPTFSRWPPREGRLRATLPCGTALRNRIFACCHSQPLLDAPIWQEICSETRCKREVIVSVLKR